MISFTHLFYRIKSNVIVLTVITLLSTFTLFAIGTTFSLYYNMNKISKEIAPLSVMYTVQTEEKESQIKSLIEENGEGQLIFSETVEYLQLNVDLSETNRFPNDYPVILLSETSFQRLAEKMGHNTSIDFNEKEVNVFSDGNLNQNKDPYTGKRVPLTNRETITIASYQDYSLLNQNIHAFPMVIKDELYKKINREVKENELQVYSLKNEKFSGELVNQIQDILFEESHGKDFTIFSTFYHQYQKLMQTYGLLIFISAFLGLVFLLATGSMLHYKLLTEAMSDQPRYSILKKVGMGRVQIRSSVAKQLVLIYGLPIIIAITHSSVVIKALSTFLGMSMLIPFTVTIVVYMAMYFVYYFITVSKYVAIINK